LFLHTAQSTDDAFEVAGVLGGGPLDPTQNVAMWSTDTIPSIPEIPEEAVDIEKPYRPMIDEIERLKREVQSGALVPTRGDIPATEDRPREITERGPVGPSAPSPNRSFEGISYTGWIPPDPILAVGPNHVCVMVNSSFAIYDKDGVQQFVTSLNNWFATLSPPGSPFDPWIFYDEHAGRWVMIALAMDTGSSQSVYLLAVSDDNNPVGNWGGWSLDATVDGTAPSGNWADYEKVGYDDSFAIYITSNQYNFGSPSSFQYSKIRVIRKSEAYWTGSPGAVNWWDFWNNTNEDGSQAFTMQPCQTLSSSPFQYFVNTESYSSGDAVTLWRMSKTWSPSLTRVGTVPVTAYTIPPNAEQLGGATRIHTGDCRLYSAVYQDGKILTGFPEAYDWGSGANSILRLLEIDVGTVSATWQMRWGANGFYYFYPAITVDTGNNNHLVFSRSGSTEYAGIRYSGRQSGATSVEGSAQLFAGEGYYSRLDSYGRNRWGDYNGIGIDPTVWGTAWIYSEYATDSNTWATRVGEISYMPYALSHDVPVNFTVIPKDFTFQIMNYDWAFVGINPTTDHDIWADDNHDFSSVYESSTMVSTTRDFVAVNGHMWGNATHYARITYGTPSSYTIEGEWEVIDLAPATPYSTSMDATEVLDGFEISLTAGTEYTLELDITAGTGDLDVFVYSPDQFDGGRTDFVWSSQNTNPGGDETITFTPTATGEHGIVVINENAAAAAYSIEVYAAPVITQTVTTSPAGLQIIVDGTPYTAPQAFNWLPGTSHTIGVSSPQSGGTGIRYEYNSWSDGGAQTHTVLTPAGDITYTSYFDTQYSLTTSANPPTGGIVSPVGETWYNSGTIVPVSATANAGFSFSGWTGDVPPGQETDNPVSITMDATKTLTANFTTSNFILTILINPTGGGTVTKDPDKPTYLAGESVELTASANSGYRFSMWEGSVPAGQETDNPLTIVMDTNKTVTAKFEVVWNVITGANAEQLIRLDTNGDGREEIFADFGALGLWLWKDNVWSLLTKSNPEKMAAADVDNDGRDELALDFGALGIWLWDLTWNKLSSDNPENIIAGDIIAGGGDELIVDFGSVGLWRWNGTWSPMTGDNPENMITADIDGNGDDEVIVDFGSVGLWRWNGTWSPMTGDNPEDMIAADLDGNGDDEVIVDFGSIGLWRWNVTWGAMTGDSPEQMMGADVDNDGKDELVIDFGSVGLWLWNDFWSKLSNYNAEDMIEADTDGDGDEEVFIDIGTSGLMYWD
jgi:hypothetical protein